MPNLLPFYPDKPKITLTRAALPSLSNDYAVQVKADGWRTLIEVRDNAPSLYTSREDKPQPVSEGLRAEVDAALNDRDVLLPPGSLLDAEWLERRPGARSEAIWLFDILRLGDRDLRQLPMIDRYLMLEQALGAAKSHRLVLPTLLWGRTSCDRIDYADYFDFHKERTPWAEGIVLKRRDSPYIGSARECALNPAWLRCKWRGGESGETEL